MPRPAGRLWSWCTDVIRFILALLLLPGLALAQAPYPGPGPVMPKLAAILDLRADFGAVCDGTTDDSAAVTAALATGKRISVPAGLVCNAPSIGATTMAGVFLGPGQIKTSDANKRGLVVSTLNAAPGVTSTWSSIGTAWNGTLSGVGLAHEHVVTGAATLGQPSSLYQQTIEASGELEYTYNSSGWNNSLSGNSGRTGLAGRYMKVDNFGQGDLNAMQCAGIVASSLTNATSYLASPEIACLAGGLYGGADGAYIEYLGDLNINGNGRDIAAGGLVMNFNRDIALEAIGVNWVGRIFTANGSKPVDSFDRMAGPTAMGIDYSSANLAFYRLASSTLNSGGTGYTVGDVITVSGGTSVGATTQWKVATVNGSGAIIAPLTLVNTGIYTSPPLAATSYSTLTVTGGTGTGANIAGQYTSNVFALLPSTGGCIQPGTSGSVVTTMSDVYGELCISKGGLSFASLGNVVIPTSTNGANVSAFGSDILAQGKNTRLFGQKVYDQAQLGGDFFSSGSYTGIGQMQISSNRMFRGIITTTTRLTSDGNAASTQNSYLMQKGVDNITFKASCIDATNGDAATWKIKSGALFLPTVGGTVTYTGDVSAATTPDASTGAGSTATLQVTADNTLKTLNMVIVPPAATGHVWYGTLTVVSADHLSF